MNRGTVIVPSCICDCCCSIVQGKRKAAADPLNDMMMYMKAKKKSADEPQTQPVNSDRISLSISLY